MSMVISAASREKVRLFLLSHTLLLSRNIEHFIKVHFIHAAITSLHFIGILPGIVRDGGLSMGNIDLLHLGCGRTTPGWTTRLERGSCMEMRSLKH